MPVCAFRIACLSLIYHLLNARIRLSMNECGCIIVDRACACVPSLGFLDLTSSSSPSSRLVDGMAVTARERARQIDMRVLMELAAAAGEGAERKKKKKELRD